MNLARVLTFDELSVLSQALAYSLPRLPGSSSQGLVARELMEKLSLASSIRAAEDQYGGRFAPAFGRCRSCNERVSVVAREDSDIGEGKRTCPKCGGEVGLRWKKRCDERGCCFAGGHEDAHSG
jgi:hypothetical protein